MTDAAAAVTEAHRRDWAGLVGATVRLVGHLDLAEECVQDAYVAALRVWSRDGVPDNPAAWLMTASRNRALDRLRHDRVHERTFALLTEPSHAGTDPVGDDRLELVFLCAHPALSMEARVALTLRLVCGLSTAEIAAAFLVTESTMAARLTRAKKKIAAARIPFRVPPPEEWAPRLDGVMTVVHLVFTTGHTAPGGRDLTRPDLVRMALELASLLHELMPREREVLGLLALVMLTDARRRARTDAHGRLVLLEDQDRSQWDGAAIDRGRALVLRALTGGRPAPPGRFALQAAIAAVHAEAGCWAETDWPQIVDLYGVLMRTWPSPVVALNRAVAHAMVVGPEAALVELDTLSTDSRLVDYPYLPAARADLLRRVGRVAEARAAYREAATLVSNEAEREYLLGRCSDLDGADLSRADLERDALERAARNGRVD